jgi:hypothetical protein
MSCLSEVTLEVAYMPKNSSLYLMKKHQPGSITSPYARYIRGTIAAKSATSAFYTQSIHRQYRRSCCRLCSMVMLFELLPLATKHYFIVYKKRLGNG